MHTVSGQKIDFLRRRSENTLQSARSAPARPPEARQGRILFFIGSKIGNIVFLPGQ